MPDTFKFPDGYDVTVCRKQDILDCLDANITDKDVVLAVIEQCELDASNFLREGRWTGIPFVGNIRIPKAKQIMQSDETKALLDDARDTLDKDKFILFKRELRASINQSVKTDRFYRYMTSQFVTKNQRFFKNISAERGDTYARILCYTLIDMEVINSISFINYD